MAVVMGLSGCVVNPVPTPSDEATGQSIRGNDPGDDSDRNANVSDADAGSTSGGEPALAADASGQDGDALGDDGGSECPAFSPTSMLFVGNSYTFYNDLPGMLTKLSSANKKTLKTDDVTKGGWTLGADPKSHASDVDTAAKINAHPWSVVVLQEQSQIPTIASLKSATMVPGAMKLAQKVKAQSACTKTWLFLTWGRKNGGKQCAGSQCSAPFKDFDEMQDALTAAYLDAASQIGGAVVPVGEAWRAALKAGGPNLFDADGSHPSEAGSYLAALTFYAALYKASPAVASPPNGMKSDDAELLQKVAAATVLDDLKKWGL